MKKISLILAILLVLSLFLPIFARAAEDESYGNAWVYDESQVISDETEDYIAYLNDNVFSGYTGKPQLAFIIVKNLPYNIDKYKIDMFNELGVGTANENRGMLFVFAINDRKYGLEIGDGFEKGSFLRKDLEADFITEDMKNSLRSGDYDAVVRQVAEHLANLMADEENGVYAQREAEKKAQDQAAANKVIEKINQIGVVTYTDECHDRIKAAKNAYSKLSSDQKKLVINYNVLTAANDRYGNLANEAFIAGLKKFGIGVCIAIPIIGLIALLIWYIRKTLREQKVDELIGHYSHQISVADLDVAVIKRAVLKGTYSDESIECIENNFLNILHKLYLTEQVEYITNTPNKLCSTKAYVDELQRVNSLQVFETCRLTHIMVLMANVDAAEVKRLTTDKSNKDLLEKFWSDNLSRIENAHITAKLKKKMRQAVDNVNGMRELTHSDIEEIFVREKNELDFRDEFDKFVAANRDKIGDTRDFDADEFYRNVTKTDHYANYSYRHRYDRSWMLPLMMMYMHHRKEERIERERREKREREERERRQREEAARRSAESMRNNNSSFGSGFGGGRSSGGGFSGGW